MSFSINRAAAAAASSGRGGDSPLANEISVDEIQDPNIFGQVFPDERCLPRAVGSGDCDAAQLALSACYSEPDHFFSASEMKTELLSFGPSILSSPKLQSRESTPSAQGIDERPGLARRDVDYLL